MTLQRRNEVPPTRTRRMLDRYELVAEIARGGMGTVMLARLEGAGGFQRYFAIKLMHAHLAQDHQFVSMLLDEARLAARIHHPNVVATVDVCESKLGYYLVMDWIEGFTLGQILAAPGLGARDRLRVGHRVLLDVMAGLDAAHGLTADDGSPLGIVHRDVSPQNVLVGLDGIARITDFGVALAASRITSSRPGMIKGKPSYMAPEQARGEQVDRRADVFALGVMHWEILTGERLFQSETDAGTVYQVIHGSIRRPREIRPDVTPGLEAVCLGALERNVHRRTPTARQMARELGRGAEPDDLVATPGEVAERLAFVFAAEIAERRASIRENLDTLGTASSAQVGSDVFDIPKLRQSSPPKGPARVRDDPALAATQELQTPPSAPGKRARRSPHASSSPAPTPSTSSTRGEPARGNGRQPPSNGVGTGPTPPDGPGEAPPHRSRLSSRVLVVWAVSVLLALVGTVWLVARMAARESEPPASPMPVPRASPDQSAVPRPQSPSPNAETPAPGPPSPNAETRAPSPSTAPTTDTRAPAPEPVGTPQGPIADAPEATPARSRRSHPQRPSSTAPPAQERRETERGRGGTLEVESNPYR